MRISACSFLFVTGCTTMNQLWRRAVNIAKSYLNDSDFSFRREVDSEDEELRRIIDELNSEKEQDKGQEQRHSQQQSQQQSRSGGQAGAARNGEMTIADACRVLQVPANADVDTIKSAYKKLIREHHPDRVATKSEDVRERAAKRSREINSAYTFLKKARNFN